MFKKTNKKLLLENYIILFFIILSFIIFWLDTFTNLDNQQKIILFVLDFIVSLVFLIDYVYNFLKSENKIMFPFKIFNIFDLLSFLPFFILVLIYWVWNYTIFALFKIFEIFKMFKVFRIFEVFRFYEQIKKNPLVNKLLWIYKNIKN